MNRGLKIWNMTAVPVLVAICFICPGLGDAAWAADTSLNETIMRRTNEILKDLKDTKYSHTTVVDEAAGKYHLDCSGLVFHVLRGSAPQNLANVPTTRSRPLAVEFHDFFAACPRQISNNGWLGIPRVIDARPGDFLVWRKKEIVKGKTTGHIMIISGKPVLEPDGRVRVEVVHSTSTTRRTGAALKLGKSGVEPRTVWCGVDDAGRPVSLYMHDEIKKPLVREMAIGRAVSIQGSKSQPGKAYLNISMNGDRLSSKECTLDPDHPFVQKGVKEGSPLVVTRHDDATKARFLVKFRNETPGNWLCIRISEAGRKRLGYGKPNKEELKLTLE